MTCRKTLRFEREQDPGCYFRLTTQLHQTGLWISCLFLQCKGRWWRLPLCWENKKGSCFKLTTSPVVYVNCMIFGTIWCVLGLTQNSKSMTWLCDPARSGKASFFQMNVNVAHLVCDCAFSPGVGDDDTFPPRQGRNQLILFWENDCNLYCFREGRNDFTKQLNKFLTISWRNCPVAPAPDCGPGPRHQIQG